MRRFQTFKASLRADLDVLRLLVQELTRSPHIPRRSTKLSLQSHRGDAQPAWACPPSPPGPVTTTTTPSLQLDRTNGHRKMLRGRRKRVGGRGAWGRAGGDGSEPLVRPAGFLMASRISQTPNHSQAQTSSEEHLFSLPKDGKRVDGQQTPAERQRRN